MGTQSAIAGIPVYVISLADAQIRRAKITARLGALGIPFRFVDAIDGRTARLPDTFDGAEIRREMFYSEGSVGCAMSHRKVHRMIAESNSQWAMIFEDDAVPAADFPAALALSRTLDCDVVKLQGSQWRPHVVVGQVGAYSLSVGTDPSKGSVAYLLSRSGAEKFCLQSFLQIIDTAFGDYRLRLKFLELTPYPVTHDGETPSDASAQLYPPHSAPRPTLLQRQLRSLKRRFGRIRNYGTRTAIRLELARTSRGLTGNTP